jgi:hypothetical protein
MSDVEKIALWVGLISSVISIVLSIVAMVFAILVNYRSEKVTDQTIKSLQKIESTVERLSDDTSNLIKGAWDTMLGSVSRSVSKGNGLSEAAAKEIASGLATEVRSEIGIAPRESSTTGVNVSEFEKKLDAALQKMQETVVSQLRSIARESRPDAIFKKLKVLERLSPAAQELAFNIKKYHLTREQYKALEKSSLSGALQELRDFGLLVPVTGHEDGKATPVYYFPSGQAKLLRSALLLLERPQYEIREAVKEELDKAGYKQD